MCPALRLLVKQGKFIFLCIFFMLKKIPHPTFLPSEHSRRLAHTGEPAAREKQVGVRIAGLLVAALFCSESAGNLPSRMNCPINESKRPRTMTALKNKDRPEALGARLHNTGLFFPRWFVRMVTESSREVGSLTAEQVCHSAMHSLANNQSQFPH